MENSAFKTGDIIVKKKNPLIYLESYPDRIKIEGVNKHNYDISSEDGQIKIGSGSGSSITFIDSFYIKDPSYYRDKKIEEILK